MTTVEQVIDDLRARGKRLPLALAGQLFCAAVRLVVKRPVSLRPHLLVLDEQEALVLVPPPEGPTRRDRPDRPGYVAPEVASGIARPDEPRALVYAAGALGYELLTGKTPPQPPRIAGAELSGPLAAVVRSALSVIRGERPPGLPALRAALETEEAPPPAEQEHAMFAALGARYNATAPSDPPAAISAQVPPARPAETAPSPPDAEVKIARVEKQGHATQAKLARLEEAVLKQTEEQQRMAQDLAAMRSEYDRTVASLGKREEKLLARLVSLETAVRASQDEALRRTEEQERMAQDLVAMRSEHDRTVASLGKREEKLLARLESLKTTVRASQGEAPRRFHSWRPFAAAAGGGALVTLILVLELGGRTPAPLPFSQQEPVQPAPQAVEAAPQPAHASPPPVVPGLGAGPSQAAPGEVSGDRALAGAPALSGGLTVEQVRKKLEENRGALRGCIDEALRRDPNLRVRKIHVATTIAPSGQVTAAEIDDRTVNQSPLGTCLKRATRRIVFPSFAGEPFDVDIPIVVTARVQ